MSSIYPQYVPVVFFPLFTEVTTGHISRINAELPQGCKLEGVFLCQEIIISWWEETGQLTW